MKTLNNTYGYSVTDHDIPELVFRWNYYIAS